PTTATSDVARLSGLDQVVRELPDGWDTVIGQGGHGLSAGQRQRLALARAFLRPAQLVVLDEPTAHLDPATEQVVYAAIERLREEGRTVVLVAHRPSLLALADRVVEVQDGPLPDAADGDGTDPGAATAPDGDTGTEPEPLTTTTGTVTA
ncbi:MAG: ATP-binding cassette domain-containing protein, partial [Kineosporiaceae bacterium]